MAEESPRPEEEDSEAEEGEEAAEAPVKEEAAEAPKEKPDTPAEPPLAPEEERPPPEASSRLPLLPTPPTFRAQNPAPPAFPVLPYRAAAYYPAYPAPAFPVTPAAATTASTTAAATTAASTTGVNVFANDGSFLELFKKKMEAGSSAATTAASTEEAPEERRPEPERRKPISFVGKRRGAKLALKTGMVAKKPKTEEEEVITQKGGAWAQYMAEVKKYKAHQCSDDDKTRPLVK